MNFENCIFSLILSYFWLSGYPLTPPFLVSQLLKIEFFFGFPNAIFILPCSGVVLFYIYYLIIKLVMKIVIVNYEKVIESKAI